MRPLESAYQQLSLWVVTPLAFVCKEMNSLQWQHKQPHYNVLIESFPLIVETTDQLNLFTLSDKPCLTIEWATFINHGC